MRRKWENRLLEGKIFSSLLLLNKSQGLVSLCWYLEKLRRNFGNYLNPMENCGYNDNILPVGPGAGASCGWRILKTATTHYDVWGWGEEVMASVFRSNLHTETQSWSQSNWVRYCHIIYQGHHSHQYHCQSFVSSHRKKSFCDQSGGKFDHLFLSFTSNLFNVHFTSLRTILLPSFAAWNTLEDCM